MAPNYPPTPCGLVATAVGFAGRREPSQASYEYAELTPYCCLRSIRAREAGAAETSESTHAIAWKMGWKSRRWERLDAGRDAILHARTRDGSLLVEAILQQYNPHPWSELLLL